MASIIKPELARDHWRKYREEKKAKKTEELMLEQGREKDAEARQAGQDYIQFYQAGFRDACEIYAQVKLKSKWQFKKVNEECKKAFELRFIKKIGAKLKEVKK